MFSSQKTSTSLSSNSTLSSWWFNTTWSGQSNSRSVDSFFLKEDMIRVAQLLVSPKYYKVIHAIAHAANTSDIEPQVFVHAQQQAAQGLTAFQWLDVLGSSQPNLQQSTPRDLWIAQYNAVLRMKAGNIAYMRINSIVNWGPEHILTARRLISALCLVKYHHSIMSASQWEIVSRFIKLLNFLDEQHFQNLAAEARTFNRPEIELVGHRSSFAPKQVKGRKETILDTIPDRRRVARNVRKTQKGVLKILWNKFFGG